MPNAKSSVANDELSIRVGRVRLTHQFQQDRFGHAIWLEGVAVPLLTSIEGDSTMDWPPSLPLQEIVQHVDAATGAICLLGVGGAGRSHFSSCIATGETVLSDAPDQGTTGQTMAGQDLEGQDLEGQDLEGQDLEGQDLEGKDLEGKDPAEPSRLSSPIRLELACRTSCRPEALSLTYRVDPGAKIDVGNDSVVLTRNGQRVVLRCATRTGLDWDASSRQLRFSAMELERKLPATFTWGLTIE
jgi:hypothetical protein